MRDGPRDIEETITRYLYGEVTPEEGRTLAAWIGADPEHARQFARMALLHDHLRAIFLNKLACRSIEGDAPTASHDAPLPHARHSVPPSARGAGVRSSLRKWPPFALLGCVGLAVILGALAFFTWPTNNVEHAAPGPNEQASAAEQPFAVLSAATNARWADESVAQTLRRGELPAGLLRLDAGTAEFTFAGGATAHIQGPAVFEIPAADRLFVRLGRVTSRCDNPQHRLTVLTAVARVTDLGTEFTVAVDNKSQTAVVVAQGKVEVQSGQRMTTLKKGDAVAFDHKGSTISPPPWVVYKLDDAVTTDASSALQRAKNLLRDPGMSVPPVVDTAATDATIWKCSQGRYADLVSDRGRQQAGAMRIRALESPLWPLVRQSVKTGPIEGRMVAASVWAMQPRDAPLRGRQNAIIKIEFLSAAGNAVGSTERYFLRTDEPADHWVCTQVTAVAPPGATAVEFQVLLNACGEKSGTILVDDAKLVLVPDSQAAPAQ